MHPGGLEDVAVNRVHHRQHCFLDGDHVGAGFPAHRQAEHGFSVDVGSGLNLVVIESYIGDIAESGNRVAAAIEHQLFEGFDTVEAAYGTQEIAPFAAFDITPGNVSVASTNSGAHVAEGESALGQPRGIHSDLHLALGAAINPHFRDVAHAFHAGTHIVFDVVADHVHVHAAGIPGKRRDAEVHEGVTGE